MKHMKKLIALAIVVLMVLSISVVAFAEGEDNTNFTSSIPEDAVSPESDFGLVEGKTYAIVSDSTESDELQIGEPEEVDLEGIVSQETDSSVDAGFAETQALIDNGEFGDMKDIQQPKGRSAYNAFYGSESDYISSQGTIQPYGVFKLAPNQILQVGLECPKNVTMDYDLYIAEVTDSGTVGNILVGSQYTTHVGSNMTNTLDEGVDYINTSTASKNYAVLVHAKQGAGSGFPYTLYYSIDAPGNYNTGECDQNAANPCGTVNVGQSVNNIILNSPADVDWFAIPINIGSIYNWADINITLTNSSTGATLTTDSVELYEHIGNNKMSLYPKTGNAYRFTPQNKEYYLRVTAKDRNNFDWHAYKLSVSVGQVSQVSIPKSISITKMSTERDTNGTNYVAYSQLGSAYSVYSLGGWFEVEGVLKDAAGNPLKNSGLRCDLTFTNHYWNGPGANPYLATRESFGYAYSDGTFSAQFSDMPSPRGIYTYRNSGSGLTHYYDLADVKIDVVTPTGDVVFSGTIDVYHEAYAMQ